MSRCSFVLRARSSRDDFDAMTSTSSSSFGERNERDPRAREDLTERFHRERERENAERTVTYGAQSESAYRYLFPRALPLVQPLRPPTSSFSSSSPLTRRNPRVPSVIANRDRLANSNRLVSLPNSLPSVPLALPPPARLRTPVPTHCQRRLSRSPQVHHR